MGNEKRVIPLHLPFLPKSIIPAVVKVLDSGWINTGPKAKEFEEMFKRKFNIRYALAVNSCTSALRLAYATVGIKRGDEIITTPYTMEATNTTILEQGAKPVFADIQYETANIDPNDIERRITNKTKAIVVVHLSGYPCDMNEIWAIGFEYDLPVIEDCAQAIGAKYDGQYIGALSDVACFSFQAIKQLTTADGGMFTTVRKNGWAEKANRLRWFGMEKKNRYTRKITELGFKYNMNDVIATIGVEQMKYIDEILRRRMEIAKFYRDELANVRKIQLMEWKPDRVCSSWVFPMHVKKMKKFFLKMRRAGIGTSIVSRRNDDHYIFGGRRKDLPNVDRIEKDLVCIPNHMNVTDDDLHYIVSKIKGGW